MFQKYVIKLTASLFSGLTSIMPLRRFWQSGGTKWGMWKLPRLTFSRSCRRLSSSKGRAPTNKAYRITPHDHTSARRPSYFSPWKKKVDILQVNNYEIVVKCFGISHNLTWYSVIVYKFTRIYQVCSTHEMT